MENTFGILFCCFVPCFLDSCINPRKPLWSFCNLWYIINYLYLPLFQNPKTHTLKFWQCIFFFWTSYIENWLFSVLRSIATELHELNLILQAKMFFHFLKPQKYYWWSYFVNQALGSGCHCVSSRWRFFIFNETEHRHNTDRRAYSKVKM